MAKKRKEEMRRFGKKPRQKLIGGIILLFLLSAVYSGYLLISNLTSNALTSIETHTYQTKALSRLADRTFSLFQSVYQDIERRRLEKTALEAAACAGLIDGGTDFEPCLYQDGAVIRIENGSVDYPEDLPEEVKIDADQLQSSEGMMFSFPDNEDYLIIYYSRIEGPLYYIEWEPYSSLAEEQRELFDPDKTMGGIEKAFNVKLLLFPAEAGPDGKHLLSYASETLTKDAFTAAEDYGITQEMLAEADRSPAAFTEEETEETGTALTGMEAGEAGTSFPEEETDESPHALKAEDVNYQYLPIDDMLYELYLQKFNSISMGEDSILACLIPVEGTLRIQTEASRLILAGFFLIGVFFLVWYCATLRLIRDHSLNDRQKKELRFSSILRRSASIIVVGCVILLFACALLSSLVRLFSTCQQVDNAFSSLQHRIEEHSYESSLTESIKKKTYEGFAGQIARILETQPDYAKAENLQLMCDIIHADYIMLFDSDGDEILSNSRYVGLSLGQDPSSSTYDFRRLLTGTPLITHDLAVDEATGEEHVIIGAGYGKPENGKNYNALLLAVPGGQIYDSTAESIDDIMSALAVGGLTAYSVDPETRLILHASKPSLRGKNVLDLGLPEKALHDGMQDFYTIGGKPVYVECNELDSALYFYMAEQSRMYDGTWPLSALSAAAAAILLALLALFLLFGYRKFFAAWSEVGQTLKEEDEIQLSGGRYKSSKDPSLRWKPAVEEHGLHAPFHLARLASTALLMVCIVILWIRVFLLTDGSEESLITFIIRGNWTKGLNLFAFTSILILFFEVLFAVELAKLLLRLVSTALGTRGETVCRLLINLTSYSGIIFFAYFTLYYLGFQPNTLLASLGLMSFAVSLGAKDLITDIIAGLSIVFEGEYQVGDIIDVGGYRGEVLEIGVRTTKLEGRGGNIKIISNRDIKNVINMTRMNSWYPLEVSISADQPIDMVEALLREQLPLIGDTIPEILSGPYYKGVISIGKGIVTLSIIAECNEGDYFVVQRALNRSIQELFAEHDINIM